MSRLTIRHGGVVKCDMPKCEQRFTTYSVVAKAREQAASAGWARVRGASVQDHEGHILAEKGRKVDLCPSCKPKPKMTGKADSP